MEWKTDSFSGLKVPTKPHLVTCELCEGVGELLGEASRGAHDPAAQVFECEDCRGSGKKLCGNVDGCCDYDPPEDD